MIKLDLNKDWLLSEELLSRSADEFFKVKSNEDAMKVDIPCDIHKPLMEYGKISDPVVADNYKSSLWIEDRSWWFSKKFSLTSEELCSKKIRLVFERLDYIADIFVNGIHTGSHKSVFFPFVRDVKEYLHEGENTVTVRLTVGLEVFSKADIKNLTSSYFFSMERYETRRILTRKPQYVFGWDWCPRIPTCGITGNVYIELAEELKINNIHVSTESVSDKEALLRIDTEYENTDSSSTINGEIDISVFFGEKEEAADKKTLFIKSGINHTVSYIRIKNPKLWWPNGMGEQPLYNAKVKISYEGGEEKFEQSFGIRKIEISTQRLNEKENEFVFAVNGKRFFARGGNWIPADSVYCNVTEEKLKMLISSAADMNCNILRIWGGGLYEHDKFYELCDEYGILVWHDFMFSCGMVPDRDEKYISLVKKELEYQIKRLRNHPCIALWCGSNENHQFYEIRKERDKLEYFGGEYIYNYYAPEAVWNYSPEIPYWNCSPYGGKHSKSNDAGDEHCWDNIFGGNPEIAFSCSIYDNYTTKFTSEYGMLGPCSIKSIKEYMGTQDIDMKSPIFIDHTNTVDNFKNKERGYIEYGIEKFYGITNPDIEEYSLYGGMVQGHIYSYSIDSHRIRKDCGGTIMWMYNDCWGESGWSVVDYYCRKKPASYFMKRSYAAQRMVLRNFDDELTLFILNDKEKETKEISYGYCSFDGTVLDEKTIKINIEHGINKIKLGINEKDCDLKKGVIYAVDKTKAIEKAVYYKEGGKMSDIPPANVKVKECKNENGSLYITLVTEGYAHGIYFEDTEREFVSDMYFDLLPGEEKTVEIKGYIGDTPELKWINK